MNSDERMSGFNSLPGTIGIFGIDVRVHRPVNGGERVDESSDDERTKGK